MSFLFVQFNQTSRALFIYIYNRTVPKSVHRFHVSKMFQSEKFMNQPPKNVADVVSLKKPRKK